MTFIAEDDEAPVGVARDGVDVQIDLLGAEEQAPLALGDSARYMGVASGADLLYQCLPSGLKQTLVLASAASPSAYTFKMKFGRSSEAGLRGGTTSSSVACRQRARVHVGTVAV